MFEIKKKCMMNFKLLGLKIAEINTAFSQSLLGIGAMVLEKGIFDIFTTTTTIIKEKRESFESLT